MQTQLYFWKPLIDRHKKELSMVEDYYNRTKQQFENIDKEVEDYANSLYMNCPAGEYTDEADFAEYAQEQAGEMYETLATMKSNHLLMTMSMLYHIWEQQLIKFAVNELRHYFKLDKRCLEYKDAQKIFELHGVKIADTKSWDKIRELKFLVNTVKHADGESADKLRKIRPDYFKHDIVEADTLELCGSVLLDSFSLQVKENDLYGYVEATKTFWDEMPERAFSDTEEIIRAFERERESHKHQNK